MWKDICPRKDVLESVIFPYFSSKRSTKLFLEFIRKNAVKIFIHPLKVVSILQVRWFDRMLFDVWRLALVQDNSKGMISNLFWKGILKDTPTIFAIVNTNITTWFGIFIKIYAWVCWWFKWNWNHHENI